MDGLGWGAGEGPSPGGLGKALGCGRCMPPWRCIPRCRAGATGSPSRCRHRLLPRLSQAGPGHRPPRLTDSGTGLCRILRFRNHSASHDRPRDVSIAVHFSFVGSLSGASSTRRSALSRGRW
uniref:Uncharacterized protein n=1 Tax=Rousettus aegyptiacus TaxID=9407 RepID=A0A7J8B8A6_ROUAE|nr:hypothetical protein HJG63_010024 [Rousettus aegyptiacus]